MESSGAGHLDSTLLIHYRSLTRLLVTGNVRFAWGRRKQYVKSEAEVGLYLQSNAVSAAGLASTAMTTTPAMVGLQVLGTVMPRNLWWSSRQNTSRLAAKRLRATPFYGNTWGGGIPKVFLRAVSPSQWMCVSCAIGAEQRRTMWSPHGLLPHKRCRLSIRLVEAGGTCPLVLCLCWVQRWWDFCSATPPALLLSWQPWRCLHTAGVWSSYQQNRAVQSRDSPSVVSLFSGGCRACADNASPSALSLSVGGAEPAPP